MYIGIWAFESVRQEPPNASMTTSSSKHLKTPYKLRDP